MTFSMTQAFWVGVDGVVAMNACQKGTGTYSFTEDTLTMTFDPTSDPGLNSDTPSYAFSELWQTVSIQPTTLDFPLVFTRLD
jgi:hypothetical protein